MAELAQLEQRLVAVERELAELKKTVTKQRLGNPWKRLKEMLANELFFGEWKQAVDDYRRLKGEEDATKEPVLAAEVRGYSTGRVLRVLTTEPGVQFYTGNYLPGTPDVNGFAKHGGFCLETQKFPDSPNQPSFPSSILKPGETYRQVTVHEFAVE